MQKYFVYFKDDGLSMGKKILSKPYKPLCEAAQAAGFPFGRGLTSPKICAKFYLLKAVTKTRIFSRIPREGAILVQGICNTAEHDTTSEPTVGNSRPGTPVIVSMSGTALRCNQGGTVEYFVSHP